MSDILYSERVDRCEILGPGSRAVLWVHGCCFSCEGCIASGFAAAAPHSMTAREAADWYLSIDGAQGITISGGEPMLQAQALSDMIALIREQTDAGVIVYTGFVYETLLEKAQRDPGIRRFLEQIDLLIDGPYIRALDRNQPYRGSENQRLIALTPRYREDVAPYYEETTGRRIEIRVKNGRALMIGVPSQEQAATWNLLKQRAART